ncbi:MAG: hypothetical protein ABI700_06500 [Chloroflexota bacterium]
MKYFALLTVLLICLIAAPLFAQSGAEFALFLGKANDHILLYRVMLEGTVTALSSPDTGDVMVYAGDSSGAAYVTRASDTSLTLHSTDLKMLAAAQTPLTGMLDARLQLTSQSIYVVGRSIENKLTLLTFDRTTLAPVAQRSTQRTDSAFTVQAQGDWVIAYNPSGALDVFSLPAITEATFQLVDVAYSEPIWSPAKARLQFIGGAKSAPNDRFLYLLDFDTAANQRFPLPAADPQASQHSQWSDHGRYIFTTTRQQPGTLILTDVSSGAQSSISEAGFILAPLSWSHDDSWLLYTAQISATSPLDLFAYNVASAESHSVRDLTHTPLTARWASDSDQLLIIAQGSDQTTSVSTTTAPLFDNWQPLIPAVNNSIVQSSIQWTGSTLLLEYNGTLLSVDTTTRSAIRLSPEAIQVVSGSVQLIG